MWLLSVRIFQIKSVKITHIYIKVTAIKQLSDVPYRKFNKKVIPAFQVQVLICTGDSGSNPGRALYRVSQKECEILRESVPYVKLYRYNAKHLYPKLNGYGDNGQRNLKLWQLLHTYWLPNIYWNWQEYLFSVMLISVLNIKVTCEWHKAIKLNYKNSRTNAALSLGFQAL